MLYKWKDKIEAQLEGKTLDEDEREELKRLRKEIKHLRMEKEILKMIKAVNLRQPPKGLVFHSDRGSQYTSHNTVIYWPVTAFEQVWGTLVLVGITQLLSVFSAA